MVRHEVISLLKKENTITKISKIGRRKNYQQKTFNLFLRWGFLMSVVSLKNERRKTFTQSLWQTKKDSISTVCQEANNSAEPFFCMSKKSRKKLKRYVENLFDIVERHPIFLKIINWPRLARWVLSFVLVIFGLIGILTPIPG